MKKRGLVLIALLVLFSIFIVYAQTFNSEKVVFNDDNDEKIGSIVSSENFNRKEIPTACCDWVKPINSFFILSLCTNYIMLAIKFIL